MRTPLRALRRLISDSKGGALVEFALVAPLFLTALIGVVQMALWVQSYNSVKNAVGDTARFAVVEYQRGNKIAANAIQAKAVSIASSGLYNLLEDDLAVTVTPQATRINGVKEMSVRMQYAPPQVIPYVNIDQLVIDYTRNVFLFDPDAVVGT